MSSSTTNAEVEAVVVVVVTAPRNKLDSNMDWDSFSAQADRVLVMARGHTT